MAEQISAQLCLKSLVHQQMKMIHLAELFGKNGKFKAACKKELIKLLQKNKANLLVGSVVEIEYFAAA